MKAARKSAGLPSLSISIPPSPTSTQGAEDDDDPTPTDNQELEDDEEDDLSDAASSICHSPSWEGFGQSAKKKAKKRGKKEKKKLEEKVIKASKKTIQQVEQGSSPRNGKRPGAKSFRPAVISTRSRTTAFQIQPENLKPQAPGNKNVKPKSRVFLASFRSSSTGSKKTSTPRGSVDESQSIHNNTFAGPPSHMYSPTAQGVDHDSTNPRQAPSIRSSTSGSTQSMSAQDKRPGMSRHSSNSGHGRSMSLLARLKGHSYLYYNGSDAEAKEDKPRPPLSRSALTSIEGMPVSQHNVRPTSALALLQNMDGAPDNGESRGRQHPAHPPRLRDSSSDYEEAGLADRRDRRLNTTGHTSAPQQPIANEGRRRPHHYAAHIKLRSGDVEAHPTGDQDTGSQKSQARELNADVQHIAHHPMRGLEEKAHRTEQAERKPDYQSNIDSYASPYRDEVDRLSVRYHFQNEEGRIFVRSHELSTKPAPGALEPQPTEQDVKMLSPSPSAIGRAVSHDDLGDATESSEDAPMIEDVVRLEEPAMVPSAHQGFQKMEKLADYFAFISESYAHPSLELRSPAENRIPFSPRIEEASDEDGEEEPSWSIMTPSLDSARDPSTQAVTATPRDPIVAQLSLLEGSPVVISPAILVDQSDSDVLAFEHLVDTVQATGAVETRYQPQSLQEAQSSGNSERSSSTNGEFRPLTSAITTPSSSRPHSRKGHSVDIVSRSTVKSALVQADERAAQKAYRASIVEPSTPTGGRNSRSSNPDTYAQDDSWSRTALPIDQDNQSVVSSRSTRLEALGLTHSLAGTPTSVAFADELKEGTEEPVRVLEHPRRHTLPPKAHSAIDLPATSFLPPLRHQPFNPRKAKMRGSSTTSLPTSLPNSPPPDLDAEAPALRPTSLKSSRNNSSTSQDSQQNPASASAAYLQEARKTVPVHPLSSRALRPVYPPKGTMPPAAHSSSPKRRGEPVAKMLVECCNCKFFHDMPSRVYKCMAKPDSVVEDKLLGVSATITTMVKCPWCAHDMTTQCCAGYAAVIYLKEKLHGK
ncbi:uncharacterized protein PG998_002985 [Apiospora kogelbergensis]|uniref:uncharacterized protein n=1 Tax=Apiospora kogelbergensis TaxID=1337665 RepID=UPI0031328560